MPVGRSTHSVCGSALFGISILSGALLLSTPLAHADVYHPIAAGETLASVARKYGVSTDALRAANGLSSSDSALLASMLLRVPGIDGEMPVAIVPGLKPAANSPIPTYVPAAPSNSTVITGASTSGSGFIARTMIETVRPGDTWDTIAARYRAAGHDVTTEDLRRRNNWADLPAAGQTVVVPLGQTSYSAPAPASTYAPRIATTANSYTRASQSAPAPQSEARSLGGGVYASPEADLPYAKVAPSQAPVFTATNGANANAGRGGYAGYARGGMSARGGYGEMARGAMGGEVRVLGPQEEASAPPAPRSSTSYDPTAMSQPVVTGANAARVAKVALHGAQIRRIPQSSAVALYRCQVGMQLAVLRQSGAWSAVLMSDRSTGWLPSKYLQLSNQTIDVSTQVVANPGPGGYARYNVGHYSTENPFVAQALTWLGTPYVYGGTSRRGIDCSSLVQHAFAANGIQLPRTAAQQAKIGQSIAPKDLRAGDRLYFSASGTRIDHTGLYMGDGLFVQASGSGRQVIVSVLTEPRNWSIFVGAKR